MELRCHWCLVSFAEIPIAVAHPCGHDICISCHHIHRPHWCVVCQREVQKAATDCGILETHTWNHHPHTPSHPSPQPHMSPFAIPSPQPLSTTHTNTTLPSTPQTHISPKTRFGLSAPKEGNHQNSIRGMDNSGDVNQVLNNTQMRKHCERLEEERKRHLKEQEQLRKEKRLQSELKQQKEKVGELQHEVTQLRERQRGQEEDMQQPMGKEHLKSLNENLLRQLETLKQENTKLEGELNCKKEEMERKEEEWAWVKKECDEQQQEIVTLQEKDCKHQEALARLEEQSARQQNRALLEDLTSLQEQIRTLTMENTELKREVTSLRGAKDAREIEATYWKEENAKQQKAAQEEMSQVRMQESRRLQNHLDKWEGKVEEMCTKLVSQERERKQLRERNSNLQNELQQVAEDWAKCREDATQLKRENEHHQKEKGKYEEEVRHLKQELSGRHAEWEEVINLQKEEIEKLEMKEATLEQDISCLIAKDIQNQEELAALRTSKEEVRCLIRERDKCQEEIDELKKKEASRKEKMAQLRRERDDYLLQIQQEDKSTLVSIELTQKINNLLLERDEFRRKEASQQQEATQLRQEREHYKEELDQLKRRESTKLTQMRGERDKCKEELDQLKERESTELTQLRKERDKYKEELDQLKGRDNTELTQMRRERDKCKEELDQLKRREVTLKNQLKQMKIDKDRDKMEIDSCKKERENHKQEADQLKRRNSTLGSQLTQTGIERHHCRSERDHYKRESNNHKEEVERLNQKHDTEITQLRQERDQHQSEAERLRREMEVASGAGEAGQREVTQLGRDLADIPVPPAYIQLCPRGAAEVKDVVTLGMEEELVTQGLPNLGNSSYINSVVQCLYHLPALRNALARYACHRYPRVYQHDQSGTGVALALAQLFGAMQNDTDTMVRFAARDLKGILGSHDASFRGRQQQEAHDLFSALVSWLQTDLSQHDVPDSPCHTSSMFNGLLETKITCLDSPTPLTHTSEAFTSLSLPVVGRNSLSLEDLLNKYFREQSLEWDCQHCRYTHECCHRTYIRSCPPVLVIHFSRVAEHRSTKKTKVDFPLTRLSLRRYMAPNAPPLPQYQLVGVVCHEGNMGSGHYIAYCRYGSGYEGNKWRMCSDEWVNDVWERDMLDDGNAHLLFYIQQ